MDSMDGSGQIRDVVDALFTDNVITSDQYNEIRIKSAQQGQSADVVLELSGIVSEEKIVEAKAKLLGIPFISLQNASFSPEALGFIPRAVVERFSLIPFHYDEQN